MRSYFSFPLICCAALSLSACQGYPTPMARGYSSYDQVYKSASGAKPHNIGYDYTSFDNRNVLQDMRYVAQDLVDKLDKKLSFSVDEIYLKVQEHTAFYNSFDHLIRDELTQRGYQLSNTPINTVTVDFIANDKLPECHPDAASNAGLYKTLYLVLALNVIEGEYSDSIGGFYEVPAFDYENTNHLEVQMPPCEIPEQEAAPAEVIVPAYEAALEAEIDVESVDTAKDVVVVEDVAVEMEGEAVIEDAVGNPTDILSAVPEE